MSSIESLLTQIKVSTDYQKNKLLLKEKIQADLHITYNGGLFCIDPTLIAFLSTWPNDELFIKDVYENPIKIVRTELLAKAQQHYHAVMNTWYVEHEELKRVRKI